MPLLNLFVPKGHSRPVLFFSHPGKGISLYPLGKVIYCNHCMFSLPECSREWPN